MPASADWLTVACEEHCSAPDGDALAAHGSAIHNFVLGERLALIALMRTLSCGLSPPNFHLHVLELDAHKQEVDLADHSILQMVLGLVVLKFYVQTVLDANLHLQRV